MFCDQWSTSRLSTSIGMLFGVLFLLTDSFISRKLAMNVAYTRTDRKILPRFLYGALLFQLK